MANGKCAVIGDRDSILIFKAVGIEVYPESDGEHANFTMHKLGRAGYAVIYVTESMYPLCAEAIAEFAGEPYPAISCIVLFQSVKNVLSALRNC